MPEIYKYSSNVGTIRIMQALGKDNYRAFLTRAGFDDALQIELPETNASNIPKTFSEVVAATAAFGHGLSITPLHMAQAYAAFVNGGVLLSGDAVSAKRGGGRGHRQAHHFARDQRAHPLSHAAQCPRGFGHPHANKFADGYRGGGKTGTAEKVESGKYVSNRNLNVFASAFPLDNPQYAMVILVDEPKPENEHSGETAGWNAGEVTGRLIARVAPLLGIPPDFSADIDEALVPEELR